MALIIRPRPNNYHSQLDCWFGKYVLYEKANKDRRWIRSVSSERRFVLQEEVRIPASFVMEK